MTGAAKRGSSLKEGAFGHLGSAIAIKGRSKGRRKVTKTVKVGTGPVSTIGAEDGSGAGPALS